MSKRQSVPSHQAQQMEVMKAMVLELQANQALFQQEMRE